MAWKEVTEMEEKQRFVTLAQSARYTISELCESFGVSRKTGHKWLKRYAEGGIEGLRQRSRAPKSVPQRTDTDIEQIIIKERRIHSTWGGKKIHKILQVKHGIQDPPVISTINAILKRNGLIKERRRRGAVYEVERKDLTEAERSQHVIAVDFKGWFSCQDGERFDPLTVTDLYSRYLMKAEGLPQMTVKWTQQAFRDMFRSEGIPEIIRVDNGSPFASMGPGGLSKLSVWWIGQGIEVEFTRPGCPQDNGSHERMHRTMKQECCQPASANRKAQQQRVNRWRKQYNEERPHEALGQRFPCELYQSSSNRLDEHIKPDLYEPGARTEKVSQSGHITFEGKSYHVGEAFAGQEVALEESPDTGTIKLKYANVNLGYIGPDSKGSLIVPKYKDRWGKKP